MSGLLLLNKPQGITSFGAVARIKRLANEKRVGHTGTLDPMATGVLPILIGRATALSQYLIDANKSYSAKIKLGTVTDTYDITGNVISVSNVKVGLADIQSVLKKFEGRQKQIPPMYSAIKQNGVRMYELARRGETAEIPARDIEVFSLDLKSTLNGENEFDIETTVSKGTYIRSLGRDIGEALGCGATLTKLCRTKTAGFSLEQCIDLDSLDTDNIFNYILPADTAVEYMPQISVTEKQAVRFSNGGQLSLGRLNQNDFLNGELYRVYCGDKFLGLGQADIQKECLNIACIIETFGR